MAGRLPAGRGAVRGDFMNRLGLVYVAVVASLVGPGASAEAQVGKPVVEGDQEIRPVARAASGSVEGLVLDDLGAPLPRVAISALGATSAVAQTDHSGRFRRDLLKN